METLQQAPWTEYLEIDKKTCERYLKEDAPERIKKLYKEYLENIKEKIKANEPITK